MSLAIDTIDMMIAEVADSANKSAARDHHSFAAFGEELGAGIRITILKQARERIMRAELKAHERERARLDHEAEYGVK